MLVTTERALVTLLGWLLVTRTVAKCSGGYWVEEVFWVEKVLAAALAPISNFFWVRNNFMSGFGFCFCCCGRLFVAVVGFFSPCFSCCLVDIIYLR